MSAFHMDIAGTADRFERIDRTGKSCAIRNNGSYMKVPCAWCSKPCNVKFDFFWVDVFGGFILD